MNRIEYIENQIDALTDGGAYGYKLRIVSGANGDGTTWINITSEELQKIKAALRND